ncbi:MAG TPA: hypothetical protein PKA98_18995, partial [Acidimicrobiales bacterium]|nr:hypothetical protein [Acidimicrobiales bacterium]
MRRSRVLLFVVLAAVLVTAACSSSSSPEAGDEDAGPTSTGEPATTTTAATFDPAAVGEVTVEGPITGGAGEAVLAQGGPDLAAARYVVP